MHQYIICEKKDGLGSITLNSEKTLNSLSVPMIAEVHAVLKQWKEDGSVACVLLQGAGEKAFCAGGDVRRLYDAILKQREIAPGEPPQDCLDFFIQEYQLNYEIHKFPKPIVVWADGIVMGGGIGLAAGASHRIVTEKSKLAMPEITIGLYPDVGGTWFLNKMPSAFGLYLGLTGTRLNAADCLYINLANHFIPSNLKLEVITRLQEAKWENNSKSNSVKVTDILNNISTGHEPGKSIAQSHQSFVSKFEKISSVSDFRETLLAYSEKDDDWINAGIKTFESGSPSSAYIIFEQLKRGRNLSLEEIFQSELNLSAQCTIHPDFAEGVRALLVDKDLSPNWQPASLEEITKSWVESYFTPLWKDSEHPLKNLGNNETVCKK
jgi:enoyl-CoA hydratase/carnithine racemase